MVLRSCLEVLLACLVVLLSCLVVLLSYLVILLSCLVALLSFLVALLSCLVVLLSCLVALLSCLVALFNRADPITFITIATVYFFSFSKGHLAVLLIQLEILALIRVYAIFLAVSGNNPVLFLALLIFK